MKREKKKERKKIWKRTKGLKEKEWIKYLMQR
jgi:hypothetical protein